MMILQVRGTLLLASDPFAAAHNASENGVKMNLTIHKQLSDLLEAAGIKGMTLNVCLNFFLQGKDALTHYHPSSGIIQRLMPVRQAHDRTPPHSCG